MKKTRGKKSRATVPLRGNTNPVAAFLTDSVTFINQEY
jgi:hypothetical protein